MRSLVCLDSKTWTFMTLNMYTKLFKTHYLVQLTRKFKYTLILKYSMNYIPKQNLQKYLLTSLYWTHFLIEIKENQLKY
jgi:hypothetical protein